MGLDVSVESQDSAVQGLVARDLAPVADSEDAAAPVLVEVPVEVVVSEVAEV